MAPPLPLIVLLMIHGVSSADWGVSYSPLHICALKDSTVIMNCTYKYPTGYKIMNVFWTNESIKGEEPPDLSNDPEYSQRLQYLGDKQQNCTIRLSHVTLKDSHMYYFRFITDKDKWIGAPGVNLTVTGDFDLQVESPERVTEGDSVNLRCKSSCALTDRATFIWYRNSQPLTLWSLSCCLGPGGRRDRNNELLLQSVRREDSGRYSCAVDGHTHISPAVQLSVMYPPKNVSVLMSGSGVIVEGDSVTLNCISDSNPPALNFSWFKENETSAVGSGQSFSALQSGRFYCQAHNQHGSQRSDAVTVTALRSRLAFIREGGVPISHSHVQAKGAPVSQPVVSSGPLGKVQTRPRAEDLFSQYGAGLGPPDGTPHRGTCLVSAELLEYCQELNSGPTETFSEAPGAFGIRSHSNAAGFASYETT
ncbi:unnamed protein product [Leuciscus chuanchicus]